MGWKNWDDVVFTIHHELGPGWRAVIGKVLWYALIVAGVGWVYGWWGHAFQ
jgi:hypothetical protein